MRILLVSHPPLASELGAAQIAIHLAEALRARGHDALAWSPEPLAPDTRWWNLWWRQRQLLARFVAEAGPFDVIDTPAITAGPDLVRRGCLVVRSIQPELLYLREDIRGDLTRTAVPSPQSLVRAALAAPRAAAILAGWRRARLILCLGSRELAWMRRRFRSWGAKLGHYFCAPSPAEREALSQVRRNRRASAGDGVRFLWIGRWARHKGTDRLLRFLRDRWNAAPADTFTLAGCGPAAERDLPREWLGSGRLRLVPAFARPELPRLLAEHDAGLFTSHVEGWGLSLAEMLESGLPVYATEAGAVEDLRPFFSGSLRPFPPPLRIDPGPPLEDLERYYERFAWPAIARDYERQVLAACALER